MPGLEWANEVSRGAEPVEADEQSLRRGSRDLVLDLAFVDRFAVCRKLREISDRDRGWAEGVWADPDEIDPDP